MPLLRRIVRSALSLALALVASVCIVRGLGRLFSGGASYGGVSAALGYFAVGILLLLGAGEAFPKAMPAPAPTPVPTPVPAPMPMPDER